MLGRSKKYFIVQSKCGSETSSEKFCQSLESRGLAYRSVHSSNGIFVDDKTLKPIDWAQIDRDSTWFYGCNNLIEEAYYQDCKINYSDQAFKHSSFVKHWADRTLNSRAVVIRIADVDKVGSIFQESFDFLIIEKDYTRFKNELCFVKPNSDLKIFSGQIVSQDRLLSFVDRLKVNNPEIDDYTEIVVGLANTDLVYNEKRLFIVDGEVISQASYGNGLDWPIGENSAKRFAEQAMSEWMPASSFVMDLILTEEGDGLSIKIVEANCIHASGFYEDHNIHEVIRSISKSNFFD